MVRIRSTFWRFDRRSPQEDCGPSHSKRDLAWQSGLRGNPSRISCPIEPGCNRLFRSDCRATGAPTLSAGGFCWNAGVVISAVPLNKIALRRVGRWIDRQTIDDGTEIESTHRSRAATPDASEAHARTPLSQSISGHRCQFCALALLSAVALAGCGTSSSPATTGSSPRVAKDQPSGKDRRQECELAAKEIARTELEHVNEVVSPESSEASELDMRVAERKTSAISKCR